MGSVTRRTWLPSRLVGALAAVVVLAGCSSGASREESSAPAGSTAPAASSAPPGEPTGVAATADATPSAVPTATATPAATPAPTTPPHPVSLPALMQKQYDGRDLDLGEVKDRTDAYTQHFVSYRSGDLTISGILNIPDGDGPFPVLILAHGYIDPEVYDNGQGLRREQDYLAREGYAVLHTDYRNHAASDDDPRSELELRLGYTEDVINAVLAVRESGIRELDGSRVGLLGRSMGGGVVQNVLTVAPGLVDAAVVYASVSSDTADNFNRWTRDDRARLSRRIISAYGAPEDSPEFWRAVSPRAYFDRITEPILVHHGTEDEECPIRWAQQTVRALERAGKDVTYRVYDGEPHAFIDQWPQSMRRTTAFFDRHLAR
jgi:dipeptidyl aminopeptidase/acylaminoacyl peptidase